MGLRKDIARGIVSLLGVKEEFPQLKTPTEQPKDRESSATVLPLEWQTATYAPGWPIQPVESPKDTEMPRSIDYPIAVNATLQPRTAYGLMPFAALKEAYETVAEVRLPISTLLREMSIFRPHLVDLNGGEIRGHPMQWLATSPDRVNTMDVWMTRFLKNVLTFDSGAFHYGWEHGKIEKIRYIDGSTLFVMVDQYGRVPSPELPSKQELAKDPEVLKRYLEKAKAWVDDGKPLPKTTPAYAQIIKGTPFGWYDRDQIWYRPKSMRFDSPYGESAIEQAWAWILICANIAGFELGHYREGNMPEGWIESPEGWSLEKIAVFEKAFNDRMTAGPSERMRARFLPHGSSWHETKKQEFPQGLYDQAMSNVSLFFGVPTSEYGKTPGEGLGGKSFEEAMQSQLFRMGLFPLRTYMESAFNEVLRRADVDDAKFELVFPGDEVDPEKHKKTIIDLFSNGLITFNSALSRLGQNKVEGGDIHLLIEYGTVVVIEEVLKAFSAGELEGGRFVIVPENDKPPKDGKPNPKIGHLAEPNENPEPINPVPERHEPANEKDYQLAEKLLMDRSFNAVNRYFSIPKIIKVSGNGKVEVTTEEAKILASKYNIDTEIVGLENWRNAIQEETNEHIELSGGDPSVGAMIARDHIKENPKYYSDSFYEHNEKLLKNDGVMVALDLEDRVAKNLLDSCLSLMPEGAEPLHPNEMHITLFYPGDLENVEFNDKQLIDAVRHFCRVYPPLVGVIGGIGVFNGGKKQQEKVPLVAFFDCAEIPEFRQGLISILRDAGIHENVPTKERHGFIPHITLAYLPSDASLEGNISVDPIPLTFKEIAVVWGNNWHHIPLQGKRNSLVKVTSGELKKHCGVCPEDDDYYGAPIYREAEFDFPDTGHVNKVEIIAMAPAGLLPKPALWKPEGGESDILQESIGGPQHVREEAAYLLDRSLRLFLVPVAYVTESKDEFGAAIMYVFRATEGKDVKNYDSQWLEKAAILDFISCQTDRHQGNYKTHPDDQSRPILIDNGLSFPAEHKLCYSPFFDAVRGKSLSEENMRNLRICLADSATWEDIGNLIGEAALEARKRAEFLLELGMIPNIDPKKPMSFTETREEDVV